MTVPLLIVGVGCKFSVISAPVVAWNSVETWKACMASGAASMLRDFRHTLGPVIIGAVALRRAAPEIGSRSPPLCDRGSRVLSGRSIRSARRPTASRPR